MDPRPPLGGGWDPSTENKTRCCFQPSHDRYSRYAALLAKSMWPGDLTMPISLNFEDGSCFHANPIKSYAAVSRQPSAVVARRREAAPHRAGRFTRVTRGTVKSVWTLCAATLSFVWPATHPALRLRGVNDLCSLLCLCLTRLSLVTPFGSRLALLTGHRSEVGLHGPLTGPRCGACIAVTPGPGRRASRYTSSWS